MDAASYHEVCQKNATTWGGRVAWRVPLELCCQPKGDLAIQYQKPPLQIQSAMYMYIYTVFAIAVYLASTYTLIYTWSTNWRNESLCFKLVLGRDLCHSCTRIELRSNKPKTVHLPRTLIFHICSKEVSIIYYIHIQHYQLNIIDYKFYLLYYVLYILCSILYIECSLLYILLS